MSDMVSVKQFDNRCILSDYVQGEREGWMSVATASVIIRRLWDNSKTMRPNGLKNSVNKDEHKGVTVLAMQDVISDAFGFQYNRRDADYKNFHYVLNTSKPVSRKLEKRFS